MKSKIYNTHTHPISLKDLKHRITQNCRYITPKIFANVRLSFNNRLFMCQEVNGRQFEHLL